MLVLVFDIGLGLLPKDKTCSLNRSTGALDELARLVLPLAIIILDRL